MVEPRTRVAGLAFRDDPDRHRLVALLAELSYRRGSFRLASGKQSDFYVDVKQTVMRADGAALLGELLMGHVAAHGISAVGGMAVGAVPLVTAALCAASRRGYPLEGFFVRKEAKAHGTERRIDGRFDPAVRIALIEDVVTTGDSTLQAIEAVEACGGKVALVVVVVDRQEDDALARLERSVPVVRSLTNRAEILAAVNA